MEKSFISEKIESIALHGAAVFIAVLLFLPIGAIIVTSLAAPEDTGMGFGYTIPPTIESHVDLWDDTPMARYLVNSVVIAIATTLLSLSVSILAAHALARRNFPGRSLIFGSILATFLVPSIFLSIPLFLLFRQYHLINTYGGIILAHSTFTIPFLTWILKGYMETVPKEIEESALIDGANRLQAIIRVVIPLAAPAILAVSILAFLGSWHQFTLNLVLANKDVMRTIPMGAMRFQSVYSGDFYSWGQVAAYAIEASLLPIIFLFLTSRYMVQGLTAGFGK